MAEIYCFETGECFDADTGRRELSVAPSDAHKHPAREYITITPAERAAVAAIRWKPMTALASLPPGTQVWLRLIDEHAYGMRVRGHRAVTADASIYYHYDTASRRHVQVYPVGWTEITAPNPTGPTNRPRAA